MNNLSQFSLRWNNYVQHVIDAFRALRNQDDLVDVTLCCEGRKIRAHKVLLSACSAYFKDIFKENPCPHPIVIFRNVKFDDLNAIVHFMYHGEVNILQEQLESFLITAEMLEVNGLTDGTEEDEKINNIPEVLPTSHSQYTTAGAPKQNVYIESDVQVDEPINLATSNNTKANEYYMPNILINNNEFSQSPIRYDSIVDQDNIQETQLSPPTVTVTQISEEMQIDNQNDNNEDSADRTNTNETDLAKFRCQLCPKGFKHPTSLTLHKDSHTGKTQCPVCHRSFSRSYDMRSHLQKIHQGKQLTIKEIRYKVSNDNVAPKTFTHQL